MNANVFVDTNIWLYALIKQSDVSKHERATQFLLPLASPKINSQVIREASKNLLHKAKLPEPQLQVILQSWYRDCTVVPSNLAQHVLASQLRQRYAFSYWDSLIVAAAIDAGCDTLFSEDMQHGQTILDQLTIINPLI